MIDAYSADYARKNTEELIFHLPAVANKKDGAK